MKIFQRFVNLRLVNFIYNILFAWILIFKMAIFAIIFCLHAHNLTYLFSIWQLSLSEGCKLPVRMNGTDDWPLAEIISIREVHGHLMFYVHYVDCK